MKLNTLLLVLAVLVIFPQRVSANEYLLQTPEININPDYIPIESGSIGAGQDQPQTPSSNQKTTIIETGSKTSNSQKPFIFSVSSNLIDFGILSPTQPTTRLQTISIDKGISGGYTLFTSEDHELKDAETSELIPDTTCDNGACTNKTAAPWKSVLVYGFGYNVNKSTEGYKRFSNKIRQEKPEAASNAAAAIIQGLYAGNTYKTDILYKVNIAGTQKAGVYENTVTLLAVPNF